MAARGRSLFSLYVLYRKTKTLLSLISLKPHAWSQSNLVRSISVQGEWINVKSYWMELFPLLPWQPGTKSLKIFFSESNGWISKLFSQKCSSIDCLSSLYKSWWYLKKHGLQGVKSVCHAHFPYISYVEKLKNSSSLKPLDGFEEYFPATHIWWLRIYIVQIRLISKKTWPPGGGAYFPYISYIEKGRPCWAWYTADPI